ncbi:hypothetical protein HK104_010290, partial [Borealophlyctis nickersoniae]
MSMNDTRPIEEGADFHAPPSAGVRTRKRKSISVPNPPTAIRRSSRKIRRPSTHVDYEIPPGAAGGALKKFHPDHGDDDHGFPDTAKSAE